MFDEDVFKQVLGSFPAGVTIVSCYDQDGNVTGLTASAFSALSLDPALVLVCPNYSSDTYPELVKEGQKFAINILAGEQQGPAFAFAKKGEAKQAAIAAVEVEKSALGTPLIKGAVATIECSLWREYEGGDHAILVGQVEALNLDDEQQPMVYCRGKMTSWQDPA